MPFPCAIAASPSPSSLSAATLAVPILNLAIALGCWYLAFRFWRLRRAMTATANALASAERSTHAVLHGAPASIARGQRGVNSLRLRYRGLGPQLEKIERALVLANWVLSLSQRWGVFPGRRSRRR